MELLERQERLESLEQGFVIESQGLRFTRALTKTQWTELGQYLVGRLESSKWAIGDWLIEGGREDWDGDGYSAAAKITGYSTQHLSTIYGTAKAFPKENRHPTLSFSAHTEIRRVEEYQRADLARMAIQKKWSCEDIRGYVKGVDATQAQKLAAITDKIVSAPRTGKRAQRFNAKCPNCSHEFPIKGNLAEVN